MVMKKAMKTLIAMATISSGCLTMGCNSFRDHPADTYEVYIDPAFGDQTEMVINALQDWEDKVHASGSPLTFHTIIVNITCDSNCYDAISIHPASKEWIVARPGAESSAIGVTYRMWYDHILDGNSEYSNVYVDGALDPNGLGYQVIRHEIGHALGLQHTAEGTIMCANVSNASPDIVDVDVQQFNDLRQ